MRQALDQLRLLDRQGPARVIVKLKTTEPARRALSNLTAEAAPAAAPPGPRDAIETLLESGRVTAIEPLFPGQAVRGLALGSRFAMSLDAEPAEDALAGLNVFNFATGEQAAEGVRALNRDRRVEYAHAIQERFLFARPRPRSTPVKKASSRSRSRSRTAPRRPQAEAIDPLRSRQWGLVAVQLAQAQSAPGFREAEDVLVAVIDSGVDAGHPDLQGILADPQNFTPGPLQDTQGHGTHVIGIVAAVRNNQVGVTGVCQSRRILSLKALGPYDGPGYYRAIRHATDQGARVINFSLGGAEDPTERLLIQRAIDRGAIVVAAMGNDYLRGNPTSFPAALPGVIAVGATNEVDRRASFSQVGPHIHLVAPGENILSTVPTYPSALADGTGYEAWPGTSMATPFVSATVALMLARRPRATRDQVAEALREGADLVDGQAGFTEEYGHGRLNVRRALAAI